MDLSWPPNYSVNAGLKNVYLDTIYSLHYPSIDNITEALVKLGPAAQLYKIRPLAPSRRFVADVQLLTKIVQTCEFFKFPIIFKLLYLLCIFSFLRLSNILPHSVPTFDHTRQLARAEYISTPDGAILLIKWSKTLQNRKDIVTIPISLLGDTPLCPIATMNAMIRLYPVFDNEPLFVVPRAQSLVPLTDSVARKHLKYISLHLGLPKMLTFHDFCVLVPPGHSRMVCL